MSHVRAANAYIRGVLEGRIPACKWVKAACLRQREDRRRWRKKSDPFQWRPEKAEEVCNFIEQLPHIKGEWARRKEKIKLQPWQQFILTTVFGWYQGDRRRFRRVYIEVPRKNAKSTLAAGVGLFMLTRDGEAGPEVYPAATTRDQAKIVFQLARAMGRKTRGLQTKYGLTVLTHNIHTLKNEGKMEPLSSDAHSLEGLNVHCSLVDELHAHKTRHVYDVLELAMGSRLQPLLWCITTAGSNRAGICYEVRTYLTKILDRVTEDDSFFGIIYTVDNEDEWMKPVSWRMANPNLGVSVYEEDIAALCKKALQMPSAVNPFKTKRLNIWVNADSSWMDMQAWERGARPEMRLEDFLGEICWVALDLASKIDIASLMMLFKRGDHYFAFGRHYLPEAAVEAGRNSQYEGWALEGRLITTPGNVIDYSRIEEDLDELGSKFEIPAVAYDRFQATQFATNMTKKGFPMVEVGQTVLNFSEPMKELEKLVLEGKFHHDGDPVLQWMVSNVVCHLDNKDNIFPRKEREENKIDGVVALIMDLNRAMYHKIEDKGSVYETRGMVIL